MQISIRLLRALLVLSLALGPRAFALNGEPPLEQKVKAAYIYNFVRFVEWPASRGSGPVRVGVVGPVKLATAMKEALEGRTVGDRPIVVRRVLSVDEAADNEVLYVSGNDLEEARRFVAPAEEKAVLTVTECDRFLKAGSLVNFFLADESVRFAVNTAALDRSPLRMSSQMLQFASIVSPEKK
jgi:hypothetical protein